MTYSARLCPNDHRLRVPVPCVFVTGIERLDTFRSSSWSSSYCALTVMLSVQQRFHRGYTGWGNTDAFPSPSLFFLSSISGVFPRFFFFLLKSPPPLPLGGNPDCRGIFVFSPESLDPGSLFKNLVSWSSHKYRSGVFPSWRS